MYPIRDSNWIFFKNINVSENVQSQFELIAAQLSEIISEVKKRGSAIFHDALFVYSSVPYRTVKMAKVSW